MIKYLFAVEQYGEAYIIPVKEVKMITLKKGQYVIDWGRNTDARFIVVKQCEDLEEAIGEMHYYAQKRKESGSDDY